MTQELIKRNWNVDKKELTPTLVGTTAVPSDLCWTTGPALMAHSYRLWLVTWWYQFRIPVGPDICHRGCAYTVHQIVQRHGVYSTANMYTVHPLKSLQIKVGY